jgi:hypothetical protein
MGNFTNWRLGSKGVSFGIEIVMLNPLSQTSDARELSRKFLVDFHYPGAFGNLNSPGDR